MAITFFSVASTPADNSTNTASPTAVTPPNSMAAGDLVILIAQSRASSGTLSMSQAGGQSWTSETQQNQTTCRRRVFWCRFNGTWGANPSVTMGATTCNEVVMLVFRPSYGENTWAVDTAFSNSAVTAPGSPYTITNSGFTPAHDNNVIVAMWAVIAANTFGSLSGTNWVQTNLGAQYRCTSGSGESSAFAYQIQGTKAASNIVSLNESASTAGAKSTEAWYESVPTLAPQENKQAQTVDAGTVTPIFDIEDYFTGGGPAWTLTGTAGAFVNDCFEYSGSDTSSYAYQNQSQRTEDWACFKMLFHSASWSDANNIIGVGMAGNSWDHTIMVGFYNDNGTTKFVLMYYTSSGQQYYIGPAVTADVWYTHHLHYKKASANPGTDGIVQWRVNGALVLNLSNVSNGGYSNVSQGFIGGVSGFVGSTITWYADDFQMGPGPFVFAAENSQAQTLDVPTITVVGSAIDLVPQENSQAQGMDTLALGQLHILAPDEDKQAEGIDACTLIFVLFQPAEDAQAQTIDGCTLIYVVFAPAENAQAQVLDVPSLTQVHVLAAQESGQAQAVDVPTLIYVVLAPAECSQAQALDVPALTQVRVLAAQEDAQAQGIDTLTLNYVVLAPAEDTQAQALDVPTIIEVPAGPAQLDPAENHQAQAVDSPDLSQIHTIECQENAQAQGQDAAALTQLHILSGQEDAQAQMMDQPELTQMHVLAAQEISQAQTVDAPVLDVLTDLTPYEGHQAQAVDDAAITQVHVLAAAGNRQTQMIDAQVIDQTHWLVVAGLTQFQAIDAVSVVVWHLRFEKILLDSKINRTIASLSVLGRSIVLGSGLTFIQAGDSKLTREIDLTSGIEKLIELSSELGLEN